MKAELLHGEATISCATPFACLGPGTRCALLVDNAVRPLIDEMLRLATLVTQSKPETELSLSQEKKVSIPSLADLQSVSASAVETSIPIRQKIESTNTHDCTLSAAITCGSQVD